MSQSSWPVFFWIKVCQRVSYPNRWKSAVIATSVPPKCYPLPSIEAHSVNSNPATTWPADLCPATTTGLSHCRAPTTALSFQIRWLLYPLHLGTRKRELWARGSQDPSKGLGEAAWSWNLSPENLPHARGAVVVRSSICYLTEINFPAKDLIFGLFEAPCSLHFY